MHTILFLPGYLEILDYLALSLFLIWYLFVNVCTLGKSHDFSAGDGVAYSYSVFDSLPQIRRMCQNVHILNTTELDMSHDLLWSASHVTLLGLKHG